VHLIVHAILQIWPYVNNEPKAHLVGRIQSVTELMWPPWFNHDEHYTTIRDDAQAWECYHRAKTTNKSIYKT